MKTTKSDHIPFAQPALWGREEEFALDALRSTWISGGPYVERLEAEFGAYVDAPHTFAVANGTAALHLAYLAAGIGVGDEVIVPGFAFMAAANIAKIAGATPVFADVDPFTWCVTATTIAPLITERTRAIVPVHTYGTVCDLDPILELASNHGLLVIEDAAESIGSKYRGRMSGTIAQMGIYSFHAAKTITTGEGGAVVTRDANLAARLKLYRSHGMGRTRYFHEVAGHNFRMTNLQAAIGCGQLEQIERITERRSRVYGAYNTCFAKMPGVTAQKVAKDVSPVMWAVAVRLDPKHYPQGRDRVMEQMLEVGIETRPGFYPASSMPGIYGPQHVPTSDSLGQNIIVLPSGPSVTASNVDRICSVLGSLAQT